MPLSTQEYRWVSANSQGVLTVDWGREGGGCNGLAFYLVSSRNGNQDKFQVEGQFRQGADFTSLTSSSNYKGRLFTQGVTQILRDSLSEG